MCVCLCGRQLMHVTPWWGACFGHSEYRIGDDMAVALASGANKLSDLQVLSVRNNRLTGPGARSLLSTLHTQHLLVLDLSRNHIGAEACAILGNTILVRSLCQVACNAAYSAHSIDTVHAAQGGPVALPEREQQQAW